MGFGKVSLPQPENIRKVWREKDECAYKSVTGDGKTPSEVKWLELAMLLLVSTL